MTRRNVWLVITSLGIGPAVGGLTFIVLTGITDAVFAEGPRGPTVAGIDDYWPMILIGAYVLGAIPALLSAGLVIYVTRWLPALWRRLLAAAAIGGVLSAGCLSFLLLGYGVVGSLYGLMVAGVIMLSGAVAGGVSLAIIEFFHPLPAKVGS